MFLGPILVPPPTPFTLTLLFAAQEMVKCVKYLRKEHAEFAHLRMRRNGNEIECALLEFTSSLAFPALLLSGA